MATKREKDLYGILARYGCILCNQHGIETNDTPTEIHHIRRYGGKRTNAPCIPLCAYHHRLGDASVHTLGKKAFARYWAFSEEDLLDKLNEQICEEGRQEPIGNR